jgi:uncharacterized protein
MKPMFRIVADGGDITANIADRLLSLTVRDEAEDKSDTVELKLDDRPMGGARAAFPKIGTVFQVSLGYAGSGLTMIGTYEVDEIRYTSPPATMEVRAKAAKMPTAFRSAETKSYHDQTLREIIEDVAGRSGFSVDIGDALGNIRVPHIDQTAESPMAFLTRISRQFNAVARPVNGKLIVVPRGGGVTPSGAPLPVYTLSEGDCGSWSFSHSARTATGESSGAQGASGGSDSGGMRVVWWDVENAEEMEYLEGGPPFENFRFGAADEATARGQAENAKGAKDRKEKEFEFERTGDAALMADQKIVLTGFRPEMPTEWRAMTVEHTLDAGGFKTRVTAELFEPKKKATGGGGSGGSGSGGASRPGQIGNDLRELPATTGSGPR